MGNLINLPNITVESVVNESNTNDKKKQLGGFDAKNYLNVRLDEEAGETSKTLTIRLLPMDLTTGNPFVKVHYHNVKVPREIAKSGYKSYLCLSKNQDIDHDKFGYKCPFCELNKKAYQESTNESDPVTVKALRDISLANMSRESVIVRCIERGKEDEGVKFWKFNIRTDKTDPYNQIIKLVNQRKAEGLAAGQDINILSILEDGYDLTVNITEGNAAPTINDVKFASPLSKDEKQMEAWVYDKKKWQEVFTPKPYDYLALISEQRVPWFDRVNNVWVDKEEYDNVSNEKKRSYENNVREAEDAITGGTITTGVNIKAMTINDDDLPY